MSKHTSRGPPRRAAGLRTPRIPKLVPGLTVFLLAALLPLRIGQFGEFVLQIGFIYVMVALGLHLLVHWAGQISFGHVAFAALGAHVTARLADAGGPFWLTIPAGLTACVAMSVFIGIPSLRIRGFHLAVVTFGFGYAADRWLFRQAWLTKGAQHLGGNEIPRPEVFGTPFSDAGLYFLILLATAFVIVVLTRLHRTKGGRAMRAVRGSEDLASSFGINVASYRVFAFMLSGAVAGLAGGLWAYSLRVVDESAFPVGLSVLFVALVVIGGAGSVWGTALVAFAFGVVPPLLGPGLAKWFGLMGPIGMLLIILKYPGGQNQAAREIVAQAGRVFGRLAGPSSLVAEASGEIAARSDGSERRDEPLALRLGPGGANRDADHTIDASAGLEVRDLSIRFGGLQVLRGVSLSAQRGKITGLIGPNGAGKSTLLNCVSGLLRPEAGRMWILGEEITRLPPHRRARIGLGRTFQHLALCRDETVRDNLLIAQHRAAGYHPLLGAMAMPRTSRVERSLSIRVDELLELLDLESIAHKAVRDVPIGTAKLVELASVLACDPSVLLLDEPTGGLSAEETERLQEILTGLREERRLSILVIAHDMRLIMAMTDYVYVLNFGEILAEGSAAAIRKNPLVIGTYLGSKKDTT